VRTETLAPLQKAVEKEIGKRISNILYQSGFQVRLFPTSLSDRFKFKEKLRDYIM